MSEMEQPCLSGPGMNVGVGRRRVDPVESR
jgi:hypothetical protein